MFSTVIKVQTVHVYCFPLSFSRHLLRVNQETLLDLYEHTITIRLWNNVDKLSPRARFDRPKAFRLPAPHKPEVVDESQDSEGMYPNGHRPTHLPNVHHDAIQKKRSRRRRSSQVLESLNDLSPRKAEQDIPMGTSDDSVKEKIGELDEAISEEAGLTNEGAESLLYEELGTDNLSLSARESSLKSVTKREISSQAILSFESLSASVSKFRGESVKDTFSYSNTNTSILSYLHSNTSIPILPYSHILISILPYSHTLILQYPHALVPIFPYYHIFIPMFSYLHTLIVPIL